MTSWLSDVLAQLGGLAPVELAAASACYTLSHAFRTTAWRNILAATADTLVPWKWAGASFLAGAGVNAVAPARMGVGIRLALARFYIRRLGWAELTRTLGVESSSTRSLAPCSWHGVSRRYRDRVSLSSHRRASCCSPCSWSSSALASSR